MVGTVTKGKFAATAMKKKRDANPKNNAPMTGGNASLMKENTESFKALARLLNAHTSVFHVKKSKLIISMDTSQNHILTKKNLYRHQQVPNLLF
jgi:hypothetical protein